MNIRYRLNPPERDERGEIPDFEKTWVCFTVSVKKAADERAANDALEFLEWYLNYKANISCALLHCVKCENGVHTDILTFDRDKRMRKQEQIQQLQYAIKEAKAALYKNLATSIPPRILAATKGAA